MKNSRKNKKKTLKNTQRAVNNKRILTAEEIEKNTGFLGTKGRLLKALMKEKEYEKRL